MEGCHALTVIRPAERPAPVHVGSQFDEAVDGSEMLGKSHTIDLK